MCLHFTIQSNTMCLVIKMDSLIISSLNCQGLGNLRKRRDVFHYLKQKSHSIYCLQDTHFDKRIDRYIAAEWGYNFFSSAFCS